MSFTGDSCWFLLIKTLLIRNNKKREAALKNKLAGTRNMCFFFTWPYCLYKLSIQTELLAQNLYSFENLSVGFILKIFLKFRKFRP